MGGSGPGFDVPGYDDHDPARSARDSPFRRWLVGEFDNPEPEYDDYDPAWRTQGIVFRRWLVDSLAAADSDLPAEAVTCFAPANRYHGLSETNAELLAILTSTTVDMVRAAHRADLKDWAREQELRDQPGLAVLDADLDRIRHRP
ncbi:hypothetical protein [Streptomyces sp. SID3343]|uniref:hypothetical protein n=1 Tax=Streptomyces sp. SID3343 TaxID=2690260 RepID=UPI0013714BF2|nr:hypothetical protein [Streptomyces sp. SID3343]MYW03394.1 hypothetical protein [Streptomyces sp. SID3343]